MGLELPADIRQRVATRYSLGGFKSEEDVLREAFDALDQIEEERLTRWRERNRLSEQQSAQSLSQPLDETAVLQRLRKRLASDGVL